MNTRLRKLSRMVEDSKTDTFREFLSDISEEWHVPKSVSKKFHEDWDNLYDLYFDIKEHVRQFGQSAFHDFNDKAPEVTQDNIRAVSESCRVLGSAFIDLYKELYSFHRGFNKMLLRLKNGTDGQIRYSESLNPSKNYKTINRYEKH